MKGHVCEKQEKKEKKQKVECCLEEGLEDGLQDGLELNKSTWIASLFLYNNGHIAKTIHKKEHAATTRPFSILLQAQNLR